MSRPQLSVYLASAAVITSILGTAPAWAADDTAIETTVTVDAAKVLRTMNPQRIGGSNIAMWIDAATYASPEVRGWLSEMKPGLIRLPGGSGSNLVYWNGNGVRDAEGKVDPSKVGPDGYPAVDYSAYAPSFSVDDKTLHPSSGGWHGNVDVKTLHEFVQAIPGAEPLPCVNAGTGRPVDAAEWVKWANKKMGFNARYWEIGNELDGSWEPGSALPFGKGQLTPAMYTQRYNDIAKAMRAVDPTIKIGGCAFAEQMIRDGGDNVNYVSIHTYPGSTTMTDQQLFAEVGKVVAREVGQVRGWIQKYQPQREKEIEVSYTEWNLAGGVSASEMFSGLWTSLFLGAMAQNGVDFATQWDCFTHGRPMADGHGLVFGDGPKHTRKAAYYAMWLWNNYMGDRLVQSKSGNELVYTYASRSNDAVYVMLVNGDHDREARVNVELSGFAAADAGEVAMVTSREYYWNPLTHLPQWSTGPRIEPIKTGQKFAATIAPFSVAYLRIPDQAKPGLSAMAQKAIGGKKTEQAPVELRFVMPSEAYVGDQVRGSVMAVVAGTDQPYTSALPPAALNANAEAKFDRSQARLTEALGQFTVQPATAGELTITAQSGGATAHHTITVKTSVPRPVIFWDFSTPPVSDQEAFQSDWKLSEDLTKRANRAVARVDLPAEGAVTSDKTRQLLMVRKLPEGEKLKRENVRGVVFEMMTSPDFACEDPNVSVQVVMQSPADWWMVLGSIPLKTATEWQKHQVDVTLEKHIKAMPSASNIWFILNTSKPARGSVFFDHVGLMVR